MLTRFDGRRTSAGPQGQKPVILIPGFSMSTYWFRADTPNRISPSSCEAGIRRLAARLPRQRSPQGVPRTVHARRSGRSDFPDAIQQVSKKTEQPVQIIAHCVGSLSVLMSLLGGNIPEGAVHSMILSQACAFIDQPFVNRLKAKAPPGGGVALFRVPSDLDARLRSAVESRGSTARSAAVLLSEPGALQERRLPPPAC